MAGADRPVKLRSRYQRFAIFRADDLTHMHEEETGLMPLIAAHFSADEIEGIEHGIVSDIPSAKMAGFMRFMLGAASRSERIGMGTGLRRARPVEVFDGLFTSVMGEVWQFGDWDRMKTVLC